MTIRELVTVFRFKVDESKLNRVEKKIESIKKHSLALGKAMTVGLTLPLGLATIGVLKFAGDFEFAMNRVQILTQSTISEFESLREKAKDLGRSTVFTAVEVADAMGFLAKSGFSVNQILATIDSALNLAAASGQDFATTADQMTNIMKTFGIEANDSARITDILAKSSSSANTNITQMAEAIKFSGASAAELGVPLGEVAGALAILGDRGIQASLAGTSFNQMLIQILKNEPKAKKALDSLGISLVNISKDGKTTLKPLTEVVRLLNESGVSTKQLIDIFDIRGFRAIAPLLKVGSDELERFINMVNTAGGEADRQAKVLMKGWRGALKALTSAIGGLAIAIGDSGLLKFFTKMAEGLTKIVRAMEKVNPATLRLAWILGGLLAIAGPVTFAMGAMAIAINALSLASLKMTLAVSGWIAMFIALLAILEDVSVWMMGGKSLIGDFLGVSYKEFSSDFSKSFSDLWSNIWTSAKDEAIKAWDSIDDYVKSVMGNWKELLKSSVTLLPGTSFWQASGQAIAEAARNPFKALFDGIMEIGGAIGSTFTPGRSNNLFSPPPGVTLGTPGSGFSSTFGDTTININIPQGVTDPQGIANEVDKRIQENNQKLIRQIQINNPTE